MRIHPLRLALPLLLAVGLPTFAGLKDSRTPEVDAAPPAGVSAWSGRWADRGSAAISLLDQGEGVLALQGSDGASNFQALCIINQATPKEAQCAGNGINHAKGFRFIYRNRIRLGDNGVLDEKWEAVHPRGRLEGEAVFTRVTAPKR